MPDKKSLETEISSPQEDFWLWAQVSHQLPEKIVVLKD